MVDLADGSVPGQPATSIGSSREQATQSGAQHHVMLVPLTIRS
jgi:hypothetical protein